VEELHVDTGIDATAGVVRRDGKPVLKFFILVYRSGDYWQARSVLTGDIAESRTEDGAVNNLLKSIDFAIELAERAGATVRQWYEGRIAIEAEPKYVQMFMDVVADQDVERSQNEAPSGHYIRKVAVARNAAA
jgi:hypothetical protein